MNKRTEIYGTHLNHYVKTTVLYPSHNESPYLSFDAEGQDKVDVDTLRDMYFSGCVIRFDNIDNDNLRYMTPVLYEEGVNEDGSKYGMVVMHKDPHNCMTFYSKEYVIVPA